VDGGNQTCVERFEGRGVARFDAEVDVTQPGRDERRQHVRFHFIRPAGDLEPHLAFEPAARDLAGHLMRPRARVAASRQKVVNPKQDQLRAAAHQHLDRRRRRAPALGSVALVERDDRTERALPRAPARRGTPSVHFQNVCVVEIDPAGIPGDAVLT
jgi:hypothetical protein